MANDIAAQFAHLDPDAAARAFAAHVTAFWDPRMRADLIARIAAGGEGLSPVTLAAAPYLR
jgi:formate dehydrogenase subunit delta